MLKCNNINVKNILCDVSFEVKRGSFTSIIGKNGSGKTTLANCIASQRKYGGSISLGNTSMLDISPCDRARIMAYLPQSLPSPNISVYDLVTLGRSPHTSLGAKLNKSDIESIDNALAVTGMTMLSNRMVPSLSGGEKQRAFLAMTLAQNTDILLLDEPTAHMDMHVAAEFTELLNRLGKTLIVIMHDLSLAIKYADNVLILDSGKQIFFGSKKDLLVTETIEKNFNVRKIENDGEIIFTV